MISGLAIVASVVAFAFIACSDDDNNSTTTTAPTTKPTSAPASGVANEQLCNDLGDMATAIQGVQALSASSTPGEARTAIAAVGTAWDATKSSAVAFEQAKATTLGTAVENLGDTIQNAGSAATLGDAQASIKAAANNVAEARASLSADANCGR